MSTLSLNSALLDSTSKVCSAFSLFRSLFCWTLPSSGDVLFKILIRNKQRDPHRIRTLFNFRKLYFEVFPMCIMLCICGFTFFSSVLVGIQLMKMLILLFPADAFSPATSKSVMWELKPCVPNVHRLFSCWIAWEASSVYSRCCDSHVDPWFLSSTTWYFLVLHSNLNGLKSFAVRYLYSYLPKKCRRGAVSRRYRTMAKYFVAYVHAIFWDPFLCIVRPSPKGGKNVRWYAHAKGSDSQNLAFRSNIWFIGKTNS